MVYFHSINSVFFRTGIPFLPNLVKSIKLIFLLGSIIDFISLTDTGIFMRSISISEFWSLCLLRDWTISCKNPTIVLLYDTCDVYENSSEDFLFHFLDGNSGFLG